MTEKFIFFLGIEILKKTVLIFYDFVSQLSPLLQHALLTPKIGYSGQKPASPVTKGIAPR